MTFLESDAYADALAVAPGQAGWPDRPGKLSTISAASTFHDLGNLIQIAASAINIVARTPAMPSIHSGPVLARARASLDQAGAIVRQTIGLIRDQAATVEAVSIADCLADVAALVGALDQRGIVVETDVEPRLPEVRGDPIGLRRAVLNLVFNARDAIAGEGAILITARTIRCDGAAAAVEIGVADDGIGMTPATIARALDPFFSTKGDGLRGMGLPMVERFVRAAGGGLAIESEPLVGTAITLRLPATQTRSD
jgi:signal transduction histidine kinase